MKKRYLFGLSSLLSLCLVACGGASSNTTTASSITTSTTTTSSATATSSAAASSNEGGHGGKTSTGTSTETSSETSTTTEDSSVATSTDTATTLTDTSGNTISSGSATVTFTTGNQSKTATISAAYLIDGVTVNITSGTYASASSSADQVVFLVINGGSLNITGTSSSYVNITKSGSAASNGQVGDEYNFYGINSGIVVSGSASTATISYAAISTAANGSNAVVATNSGTVTIKNSTITTTGSAGSRGLHTTYDGSITADTVEIETQGASCATLANDRGGGTIVASNMTLETNSNGSPLVYSTDSITVKNSTGTANSAQMVVVEGGSSANLNACTFSCTGDGNRTGTSDSSSTTHTIDAGGIFIYQSVSGDSEEGTDYFTATDCTLKVTTSGVPMFYLTNITAVITLDGNTFTQASTSDYFLMAEATNQWGTTGSNGATVTMSLTDQDVDSYTAFVGSTSSLTVTATDSSNTGITKKSS
ncbi:MAG: hypothetical protein K5762_03225 [Bacilli bacterium]|nr:hypothetical protein [Bacilli bacterium]